jgi:hypothetical protein
VNTYLSMTARSVCQIRFRTIGAGAASAEACSTPGIPTRAPARKIRDRREREHTKRAY